jgi:Ca2+-binding RTX toxin-like protein
VPETNRRKALIRRTLVLLVLGASAAVIAAPTANAGDILRRCSIVGCEPEIDFQAYPGERNLIHFISTTGLIDDPTSGRLVLIDEGSPFTLGNVPFPAGNGCRYESARRFRRFGPWSIPDDRHVVSCPDHPARTVLQLGDRNDEATYTIGPVEISGGPGNDVIWANAEGSGTLRGEEGDDTLIGSSESDVLLGGPGRDLLDGGFGPDDLSGGPGEDTVTYDDWNPNAEREFQRVGVHVSIGAGQGDDGSRQDGSGRRDTVRSDVENLRGTANDDTLIGDSSENTLIGLGGDDVLMGLGGADTLLGGGITDFVGRDGRRYFWGGANRLLGGAGDDTLTGGFENDALDGGDGNDVLHGDEVGVQREGTDTLRGGAGRDLLDGGRFARDPRTGRVSKDRIYGDTGVDTVTYAGRVANLAVSLDGAANDGEAGERDNVYRDVERVLGGEGDDRLTGSPVDNALIGNGGNDVLDGGRGHDDLVGGPGPHDSVRYSTRTAPLEITLDDSFNDGERNEQDNVRRSVEEVFGGLGDDVLIGNELANFLYGGDGHDELRGQAGADLLEGEAGPDLFFAADGVADTVRGGADVDCAQVDPGLDAVELVESFFPCAAPPPPPPPPSPSPSPPPPPPPTPQCADGTDNDGDGKVDLDDPGCESATDDSESPDPALPQCSDGKDNDGDGKVDLDDPGCESAKDNSESPDPKLPQCSNGKDDDGDGNVDYPNDKECSSKDDDDETK